METFPPILAQAYAMAVSGLRACYEEHGIVAGRHHYDDYWTRDAGFAWLAALELGDFDPVRRHLSLLCSFQRRDGMIPFLIRRHWSPLSGFGLKVGVRPRPKFRSHKVLYLSEVMDSNPFFAIGLTEFLRREKGSREEFLPHLEASLRWCSKKMGADGLVREGWMGGWNDGIYKSGKTLLTNVLFGRAFAECEAFLPDFSGVAETIREGIRREFFGGRYFLDWIDGKRHDHFDSVANFLAVLWGIADTGQAEGILDFAFDHLFEPPLIGTAYPPYGLDRVEIGNRITGLSGYGRGTMYWLEPICLFAIGLAELGHRAAAVQFLTGLAELIVRHHGVFEIYELENAEFRPVRRRLFRSEYPFARSSGLFVLACWKLGLV